MNRLRERWERRGAADRQAALAEAHGEALAFAAYWSAGERADERAERSRRG
jgi:hypothetical protein